MNSNEIIDYLTDLGYLGFFLWILQIFPAFVFSPVWIIKFIYDFALYLIPSIQAADEMIKRAEKTEYQEFLRKEKITHLHPPGKMTPEQIERIEQRLAHDD